MKSCSWFARQNRAVRRAMAVLALLSILAGAAACGGTTPATSAASQKIQVRDDLNHVVTLAHPAHRLVVLEPSAFEIVDALGLRRDIVGVSTAVPSYTPGAWRAAAHGLPSVGTSYPGVSAEQIASRRPDLVIATTGITGLGGLKALHIPVMVLNPQSVSAVYHDIQLVGQVTGTSRRASTLIKHFRSQLQALSARALARPGRPLVFYDLGGLYTSGPHTFINTLIQMAGGVNLGARLSKQQWPAVTAEKVVAGNPAIILIDPHAGSVAKERALPGFASTKAGAHGKILAIPHSSYLNEPSLGLVQGLRELIQLIHPHALS